MRNTPQTRDVDMLHQMRMLSVLHPSIKKSCRIALVRSKGRVFLCVRSEEPTRSTTEEFEEKTQE